MDDMIDMVNFFADQMMNYHWINEKLDDEATVSMV